MKRLLQKHLVSLAFPARCCFCKHILEPNASASRSYELSCQGCLDQVCGSFFDRCYTCGAGLGGKNPFGNRCKLCTNDQLHFSRAFAIGDYRDRLRHHVIDMKRQFDDVQALQLGELWGSLFEPTGIMDEIDLIAPIPTHWSRRLQRRGFHASRLISEGIRRMTGVPIANHLIKQNRMTSKQGKLTIRQRFQNLKGAFSCNRKNNVQDMRVLLVDDVMTSGATASEAARVVCAAGAQKVFVGVVARGARVS